MQTILLATDGSEGSELALAFAIDLAQGTGATLEIVSVRPQRFAGQRAAGAPVRPVEELDGPERIADTAMQTARSAGVLARAHPAHGDVVSCIADAATTLGADVLIVGSRGLGSVSGAQLGSVSQALVRRSPIPVTVVRHLRSQVASAARV